MKEILIIKGGHPLKGTIKPVPNKNAILALLPLSILTTKTVTYENIPKSPDVLKMLTLLEKLGADIKVQKGWKETEGGKVKITIKKIKTHKVDEKIGSTFRASILLAGPLLARRGKAYIPMPGGCVLGARSISAHIENFNKLGIKATFDPKGVLFEETKKDKTSFLWQTEASVTATENTISYLAGREGKAITVFNSATEPHVVQVQETLEKMGIKIEGKGSNKVTIKGLNFVKINGATVTVQPDFIDIAGTIVAAAVTRGKVRIRDAYVPQVSEGIIQTIKKFSVPIQIEGRDIIVDATNAKLSIKKHINKFPLAGKNLPKLNAQPWPGFPVDALPMMVTLACKTEGEILIQNWMYETGLNFANILNKLGASIFISDPQRILVKGPVNFNGGRVTSPGIIQATFALFLAGLSGTGTTIIEGSEVLKRRYPNIIEVYKKLGADLKTKIVNDDYY